MNTTETPAAQPITDPVGIMATFKPIGDRYYQVSDTGPGLYPQIVLWGRGFADQDVEAARAALVRECPDAADLPARPHLSRCWFAWCSHQDRFGCYPLRFSRPGAGRYPITVVDFNLTEDGQFADVAQDDPAIEPVLVFIDADVEAGADALARIRTQAPTAADTDDPGYWRADARAVLNAVRSRRAAESAVAR